jgi:hypothetical protein
VCEGTPTIARLREGTGVFEVVRYLISEEIGAADRIRTCDHLVRSLNEGSKRIASRDGSGDRCLKVRLLVAGRPLQIYRKSEPSITRHSEFPQNSRNYMATLSLGAVSSA